MTNSPLKGWFVWLWREALSCHLHFSLLINLQPGDKAQRGSSRKAEQPPKPLCCSDISTQTFPLGFSSTCRHWGALQPAHAGSLWLPTGNTALGETHWKHWVQNPNWLVLCWGICLPSTDCVLQPEPVWGAKLKFSLVIPGPELPDCWAPAFVHLTHLFCHLKITPDIAAGPFWEAEKSLALLYSISQCGISWG